MNVVNKTVRRIKQPTLRLAEVMVTWRRKKIAGLKMVTKRKPIKIPKKIKKTKYVDKDDCFIKFSP